MAHITPPRLLENRVDIDVVGCGGNGSQMVTGLARLNHALTELGHPGLHVEVFDPDIVSEANMGRQLFGLYDVGNSKAHTLVNRVNASFGLAWSAHFCRYRPTTQADITIVCVDSAKARHEINRELSRLGRRAAYVMDLGNRAADGQVLLGELDHTLNSAPAGSVRLPSPYDVLPELVDITAQEDDTPSCGLAEALARQELFVNQAVVTPALHILWELFRNGRLSWHGAFVNLRTGSMRPLLVPEAPPAAPATTTTEEQTQ